ncbi:MAG TPA: M23 family metallopeptidase [Lacipirellulaceae bacterium]|nr:M23 family metallopeptidase [Lacipirellulaceae bacterium]
MKPWWLLATVLIVHSNALQRAAAAEPPSEYPLDYPAAQQFCPPTEGFFEEVQRTLDRVGTHTFRHQPNGGYGLPVVDKVGKANLLHLGADVGFYRVGEPVFAVADGIVRMSQGPLKDEGTSEKQRGATKAGKKSPVLEWGNLIVLEHRLPDGKFATTIYGHLSNDRLVKTGDVVRAGQQIGTIGATHVNGGYKPHLHLGVREGRMAEVGRKLMVMSVDGKATSLQIAELRDHSIVLTGAKDLPDELTMGLDGRKFRFTKQGDRAEVDAAFLTYIPSPDFLIVGYGLSTDGWEDPIAFLRVHGADVNPAPFTRAPRQAAARMGLR